MFNFALLKESKPIRLFRYQPSKTVVHLPGHLGTGSVPLLNLLKEAGYPWDTDSYEWYYLFEPENEKMKSIFEPKAVNWLRDLITSFVVRPVFKMLFPEEIPAPGVVTVGRPLV